MPGGEPAPMRSSMVSVKIGNRTYPAVRSSRCKICIHPARVQIEEKMLLNDTYPSIVSWVSGRQYVEADGTRIDWPDITAQQLSYHYTRDHCPMNTAVLRQLTAERERELGIDYSQVAQRVVDPVIFTKLVLATGQERLARGEIAPDVKETLVAAKMLQDIEAIGGNDELERLQQYAAAMEIYFAETRRIMTDEQFQQLAAALYANPVLRELTAKIESADQSEEIYDAEIVGETA